MEEHVGLQEVAEGLHAVSLGEGVAALLHQTEPGPDSCDVCGHWEVSDCGQEV